MSEIISNFLPLWQESITGVNLPATLLFGIILIFWILNIIGVLGTELLDFLIPVDFGSIDIPILSGDTFAGIFDFFYIGKVPLVILFSVFDGVFSLTHLITLKCVKNTHR